MMQFAAFVLCTLKCVSAIIISRWEGVMHTYMSKAFALGTCRSMRRTSLYSLELHAPRHDDCLPSRKPTMYLEKSASICLRISMSSDDRAGDPSLTTVNWPRTSVLLNRDMMHQGNRCKISAGNLETNPSPFTVNAAVVIREWRQNAQANGKSCSDRPRKKMLLSSSSPPSSSTPLAACTRTEPFKNICCC